MKYRLIFTIVLATVLFKAHAQSDSVLRRNLRALENYAATHPIEKVHLHLDRQFYFPGDTIWFKAYTVIGPEHKLSVLSRILYVELISPKDSLIKRLTLGLQAGTAPGDFELPYNATPGLYRIRAYTNWMRNFGAEYFFDELVNVSGFNTAPPVVTSNDSKVEMQFFPEGGALVNGLRSKVAFKAVNADGIAEEVQGSIIDNAGNEVATFTSQHLGMGAFPLQPATGKQYIAKVTTADGSRFSVLLPQSADAGYSLTINNSPGDSIYVKVSAKNVTDTAFYLLAQSGGKYYYAAAHKLEDKTYAEAIEKSRFPTGIVQFALFGQNGEPLNNRVVFIQHDDRLKLEVNTDKQSYAPGEEVKLSISAKDNDNQPVAGTFSVSVTDESQAPGDEAAENTIVSDILLQSETGGLITGANYYFINPTEKTKTDLDLLMLTQAYHRFTWQKILADKDSILYKPEKGFTISGSVSTPGGKPVAKGKVILTSTKNMLVLDTLTGNNGKFAFENIVLPDTARLVINARQANGKENVVLTIDKPDFPAINPINRKQVGYIANHFKPDAEQVKQAYAVWRQDSLGHTIMLKEVKVKDKPIDPFHPDYTKILKYSANLNGPGVANQVYLAGDELLKYTTLPEALAGKLNDVELPWKPSFGKGAGAAYSRREIMRHLTGPAKPMAIYINGVQGPPDALNWINPADVYSVEVLTSAMYSSIYGSDAAGGALIVTLKNGSEIPDRQIMSPGLIMYRYNGFYKAFQFKLLNFSATRGVTAAGNRETICWLPEISIGNDTTARFFNKEGKAPCRVIAEGIGGDGQMCRQELTYRVDMVE